MNEIQGSKLVKRFLFLRFALTLLLAEFWANRTIANDEINATEYIEHEYNDSMDHTTIENIVLHIPVFII